MVPEAKLEETEHGLAPRGDGWYVLNMRDAEWRHADGRGAVCLVGDDFEGWRRFDQLGVNPFVLMPGEPMSMYHWEADQEGFLVVSGEALLIVEGEERPLRAWDFVHAPAGHAARDRRGRRRAVSRDRDRVTPAFRGARRARLPGRRRRRATRCERRGGHDGRRRRVRLGAGANTDHVPRRLAAGVIEERNQLALELFAPLGPTYDRYASLLSFGQDPRWRRFLVSRIEATPDDTILDVATGTGAVAIELVRRTGCSVVGVDQSREMLDVARERVARAGLSARIQLRGGERREPAVSRRRVRRAHVHVPVPVRARTRPRPSASWRASSDRAGSIGSLEFGVPGGIARPFWELYVRVGLPVAGRLISPGWHEVGRSSARASGRSPRRGRRSASRAAWDEAGIGTCGRGASASAAASSSGACAGERRAAARLLRARDRRLARLRDAAPPAVHAWHLSYVVIGAALAPELPVNRLVWGLIAFALALGVGAHALDELHGHPLRTAIPDKVLIALAVVSIGAAAAIGVGGAFAWTFWLAPLRRLRRVPRPRVQPRALRRAVPLGSLVRARLGSLPRPDRLRRRGGDAQARSRSSRRCSRRA